jgi:hypothetical protein
MLRVHSVTVHVGLMWDGGGYARTFQQDEVLPSIGILHGAIPVPALNSQMHTQRKTFH